VVFQVVIVSGKGLAFSWATLMERAQERQSPAAHQEQANNVNTYNILLLGPTGVGKSTFINALYNYLVYPTLDDTLKGGVQSLEFTSSKFVRGVLDKKTVVVPSRLVAPAPRNVRLACSPRRAVYSSDRHSRYRGHQRL
jgi:ABC-type cobalamin/Fe3+-siderophores transport system ATPase subunit